MRILNSKFKQIYKHRQIYFMLIPIMAFIIIFRYIPMINQFILAFKNYDYGRGILGSPWVGFEYFQKAFRSIDFPIIVRNTVVIAVLRLLWGFWPPIVLAILLDDLWYPTFRRISQSILYLPHFFSWVIVYGIVYAFLSPTGVVNQWLKSIGRNQIDFLLSTEWFRTLIIGTGIWKELGWGTIIYLAALSGIDPQLYEAAQIDGVGVLQRILYITLPQLKPVIVFVFTLNLGSLIVAGFEQIYLFQSPATYEVSDTIETWVYRRGLLGMEISFATAVGLFQSFVGLILILVGNKLAHKWADTGIW